MNESKMRLIGQTALITGANSGIGYAVAMNMAKEGANIVINYVSNEEAAFAAVESAKLIGNGNVIAIKADVSKEDQVQAMFAESIKKFGTIDILVNNAGLQKDSPFADMTLAQWQLVIDVNLTGQFLCSREAVREFTRRGAVPYSKAIGKIICMSSVHEMIPWAGHANYAASKGGVMLLMKTMAQELGPQKIRINSIGPGAIKTPINTSAWETPEAEAKLLKLIPYKRVGVPDDIGDVAVFLASEEADYIHGTTIYVDGGMTLFPEFATGG